MKKILVYGDSNTWGDNFIEGSRIPDDKQWVNILREKYKNGKDTFLSTFRTNAPVDIVIISLGTNDLQIKYNKTAQQIIDDLNWYKEVLEESFSDIDDKKKYFNNKMPRIIYILPINFDYKVNASVVFNEKSESKRQEIIKYFSKYDNVIVGNDLELFDDGIHLNYEGHKKMSELVEDFLNE